MNARIKQAEKEIGAVGKSYNSRFGSIKKRINTAYGGISSGGADAGGAKVWKNVNGVWKQE